MLPNRILPSVNARISYCFRGGELVVRSENMNLTGWILIALGALLIVVPGAFFYQYIQNLVAAGIASSTTTTSPATSLALLNGMENSPIMVTLSFFGLSFTIAGAVFVAGGHIGQEIAKRTPPAVYTPPVPTPVTAQAQSRACMKCGSLVSQNSSYCPNCGNPMIKPQTMIPA